MRKNYLLKNFALILMLFLLGCRNDLQNDNPQPSSSYVHQVTKQIVSLKEVSVFNNFLQKSKTSKSVSNVYYKLSNENEIVIIKKDRRVSYSTIIKGENKNFTVLVYSVTNDNKEFSFIAKYFPDSEFSNYEINNFTGNVSYENIDGKSLGSIKMINGIPTKTNRSKSNSTTTARIDCYYEPVVTAVSCTAGGNHYPGQSCSGTADQQPYYDVTFMLNCNQVYNSFPPEGGGDYGGGATSPMLSMSAPKALNYMLAQIGMSSLTSQQYNFVNSNTTIANNFKNYFYNNQNIDGANFLYWGINFFMQNPTISWQQFQNWFINGYSENFKTKLIQLTSSEVQEYITINREIDISPYQEEYIKETNEAFVAFAGYADIETMTDAQIEYVLNNNCCAGLFIQYYVSEKVKTIKANYKLLKKLYPSWGKGKIFWHAARDTIHLFLDIAGTVPVIGEVCDLTNGVIYTIEGDALNATLSYAGTIPIAGWGATGAKMAIKTVAGGISLAMIKNADGFYVVSRNQQLFRKVLGMAKGDARIAHHIIPFAIQTNPVVQKAMFSKNSFMINEALNGIPVSSTVHAGSHSNYDNIIKNYLNNWNSTNPNASPDQAYNYVMFVIQKAKTAIQNNPTIKINDLTF